jgi:Phosphotransferase enzyme family
MSTEYERGAGIDVWSSASWRERAVRWLDEQLLATGVERTGGIEQPHLRPWATVLKAPTTRGPVWLKALGPGTAFEAGLYEILQSVDPDRVLTPIAIDTDRGWILLPDGGPSLGDRFTGAELVDALAAALPLYGQLQRDLAPHARSLLALGVADMRAEAMPGRLDEALEAVGGYVERRGDEDDRETYQRVVALRPIFASWCEGLSIGPMPPSLDHNDLHPWNILISEGDGAGGARFYDWGDSVVAHPFASMLLPLGWVRYRLGFGLDDAIFLRVRDAYLEVFGDLAPRAELVGALELACRVGKVARALTWARAVSALGDDEAGEFAGAPLHNLGSLPDDSYLGGDF